jgi:hypothetical protein
MPTDSLISQSLSSLINGVSRQPAQQRLPSQAQEQVNVVSDVAAGAKRRPPSEHLALLTGSFTAVPTGGVKIHTIDRGDGQQFAVVIEDGDINVYDLTDGSEVVVNDNADGTPGAYTYLDFNTATETAETAFELVTVADYTFVVNKTIATAMSGVTSTARANAHELLLIAEVGGPDGFTNIIELGFDSDSTANAGPVTQSSEETMDLLCTALTGIANPSDTIGTAGGSILDWKFTRISGNVLHAYQFQNANDLVTSSDRYGDTIHTLLATGPNGEVPQISRFSDLPARAADGFVVKVKGDDGDDEDDFYVIYSDDDSVWKEWVAPGLDDAFDEDVMPHALVYNESTGEFSFEPVTWDERLVGDTLSAAVPSFIGNTINDILVHKNRLMLVSDENVIASGSGSFFNFWPTTVTTLVDSDPFDIAGTGNRVSIWDYATPFKGKLSLFSSTGDVVSEVKGSRDEPLTLKNARVEERGAWAMSEVRPAAAGDSLYFLQDRGSHASVMQYSESNLDVYRADEITSHVADYLPGGIFKIAAGRAENMLCFLSNEAAEDHKVFVFGFFFIGDEQVMSSWSEWAFADDDIVLDASWIESILYVLVSRQDGIHLEKIDFGKIDEDEAAFTENLGYRVHLDSLVHLTGTYDAPSNITTWTLPYDQATNGGTYRIIRGGEWDAARGSQINVLSQATDLSITALGDFTAAPVYIGREYTSTYELSEIVLRGGTGDTAKGARIAGRLQLRQGRIVYANTGTFNVRLLSQDDDDEYSVTFVSQFLNQAIFGATGLDDGVFTFHIGADARNARIIIDSASFLPFTLANAEWEGRFFQRSSQA